MTLQRSFPHVYSLFNRDTPPSKVPPGRVRNRRDSHRWVKLTANRLMLNVPRNRVRVRNARRPDDWLSLMWLNSRRDAADARLQRLP